jgi:Asp-tRNA(Asn)/Glu-tRNA(Gln) amidotransferase C subunit
MGALASDMASIIALMDSLRSVDMGNDAYEPDSVPFEALREDVVFQSVPPELFLAQAPGPEGDGFTIPRMMES